MREALAPHAASSSSGEGLGLGAEHARSNSESLGGGGVARNIDWCARPGAGRPIQAMGPPLPLGPRRAGRVACPRDQGARRYKNGGADHDPRRRLTYSLTRKGGRD